LNKFGRYIREFPSPLIPESPENPRRGPLVLDSISFPLMTHHIEVFTWIREGTPFHPGRSFKIPLTSLSKEGRNLLEKWIEASPAPFYRVQDGGFVYTPRPMYHTVDEIFVYFGTDPNNIMDLGGKIEFWLGGGKDAEKYVITKPSVIFVPAGLIHGPIVAREVRRPIQQVIIFTRPQVIEHGVDVWPPEYKP
jgi:hypothetical protein